MRFLKKYLKFVWLIITFLVAKIVVEIIHEGGHYLVALLTIGYVEKIYISILWPYKLSYVIADVKGFPANLFFAAAGIALTIFISYIITFMILPRIESNVKISMLVSPFFVWFLFGIFLIQ